MHIVSLFDAKTHLSRIVEELTTGRESEVIISRHGKPMVKVIPIQHKDVAQRVGLAKGKFTVPDDIDAANAEITRLFAAEGKGPYETAS